MANKTSSEIKKYPKVEDYFKNRRAYKKYVDSATISKAEIDEIVALAQRRPNSINGQIGRIIVIDDKARIKDLASKLFLGEQVMNASVFMIICADFNLWQKSFSITNNTKIEDTEQLDNYMASYESLVNAGIEVGLIAQALDSIVQSRGYGSTCIGHVRKNIGYIIDTFKLPKYVVPMLGFSFGVIDTSYKTLVKPRLPLSVFKINQEGYNPITDLEIQTMDSAIKAWNEKLETGSKMVWSNGVAKAFQTLYKFDQLRYRYEKQGIKINEPRFVKENPFNQDNVTVTS